MRTYPSISGNSYTMHYYPFGMVMPGREYTSGEYKFGFNGKEVESNSFDANVSFEMRMYNARLGKFLSIDPLYWKYPQQSSFCFAADNPILLIDYLGMEPGEAEHGDSRKSTFNDVDGNLKECVEYWDATADAGGQKGAWVDYNPSPFLQQSVSNKRIIIENDDIARANKHKELEDYLKGVDQRLASRNKDIDAAIKTAEASIERTDQVLANNRWTGSQVQIVKEVNTITESNQVIDHSGSLITSENINKASTVLLSSKDPKLILAASAAIAVSEAIMIGQYIWESNVPVIVYTTTTITTYSIVYAKGGPKNIYDDEISPWTAEKLKKEYDLARAGRDTKLLRRIDEERKRRGRKIGKNKSWE